MSNPAPSPLRLLHTPLPLVRLAPSGQADFIHSHLIWSGPSRRGGSSATDVCPRLLADGSEAAVSPYREILQFELEGCSKSSTLVGDREWPLVV